MNISTRLRSLMWLAFAGFFPFSISSLQAGLTLNDASAAIDARVRIANSPSDPNPILNNDDQPRMSFDSSYSAAAHAHAENQAASGTLTANLQASVGVTGNSLFFSSMGSGEATLTCFDESSPFCSDNSGANSTADG